MGKGYEKSVHGNGNTNGSGYMFNPTHKEIQITAAQSVLPFDLEV